MSPANIILGLSNCLCALLAIALAIPLVRRRVPMNRIYGVRLRRAFESEALWYEINAFGGRRMIGWSIVLLVIGAGTFVVPLAGRDWLVVMLALAPLVLCIACLETWRFARRM